MYDIAIIGAGPAGATLSRLLAKDYRILLLDKTSPAGLKSQGKCCGGLLAPDAQVALAQLGLGVPRSVLVGPQLFTVETFDLQSKVQRYYQRHYINIDRSSFDHWLRSSIPSCVDLRYRAIFRSANRIQDGWAIRFTLDGQEHLENSRLLIGADGAFSAVRRKLFLHSKVPKTYVAIQEWFAIEAPPPSFSAIFDEEITDFYAWTIPKEQHLLLGVALPIGPSAPERFRLLKKKLIERGFPFNQPFKKEGTFIYRPTHMDQILLGSNEVALVGEAAGWISPSSAEGFSYAFRSAIALAESLLSGIEGFHQRYHRATRSLCINILGKNLKSPAMYSPPLRRFVMATGIHSIHILPRQSTYNNNLISP